VKIYSFLTKAIFALTCVDIVIFSIVKTLVFIEVCESTSLTRSIEYICFLSFIPLFTYLVRSTIGAIKKIQKEHIDDMQRRIAGTDGFIDASSIISLADRYGKITYVNKKFEEVSGWKLEEVIGKDHSIVNSGVQPDGYWGEMYKTVLAGGIWNDVVTNRTKSGELYYVDTYIRARFDRNGELEGFSSIRQDITDIVKSSKELEKKNTYLEHAAKIIRHDMHSGINTYMPRGLSSFERRMPEDKQKELKIDAPLKMIKEGLRHTQKVYKGVYEFTNLVKKDAVLNTESCNLKEILEDYLSATAYRPQVEIEDLGTSEVNEALFCTAVDNLIRNGLKYNDSDCKKVKIYRIDNDIFIEDNGRGMSQEDFKHLSQPYTRKEGQKETGTGLGLNICIAILEEHNFSVDCNKLPQGGTQMKISLH
jgi:PAS domain S-box-containing protein